MNATRPSHRLLGPSIAIALLAAAPAFAQNISGAIFTTTSDGATVNGNNYASKEAVYLNGGPQNCTAPGLPDGDYYFAVTDPSGALLLSIDPVHERKFRVSSASSGKIAENLGTHATGTSPCAGAISIRLARSATDFADTPNAGGVYKAWITRAGDFDAYCHGIDCGLDGFIHGDTKTDNFRVRAFAPEAPQGDLEVLKYYDHDVDGVYGAGDTPLAGWPMSIDPDVPPNPQLTSAAGLAFWGGLPAAEGSGTAYTVTEGEPVQGNWFNSQPSDGSMLDGDTVGTPISATTTVLADGTARLEFGNFCTAGSGGLTLGFWSNKNGESTMKDAGSLEPELALLRSRNLRNGNGSHFDPTTYKQFNTWLLSATATNMAYMLSAQMAAMVLNVEANKVDPDAFYVPFGGTVGQLLAAADASLASTGYTVAAGAARSQQEALKNHLDRLNNGAAVVPTAPCAYTFAAAAAVPAP